MKLIKPYSPGSRLSSKAAGHRVFIDRHLDVGIEWAKEIERQVRAADVVIPLLSAASVRSEMMAFEIRTAYEAAQTQKGKPRLLPVRVNYLEALPDEIRVALDHLQYFLWTGPQDNQSLIENMKRALQNPPAANPNPPSESLYQSPCWNGGWCGALGFARLRCARGGQ